MHGIAHAKTPQSILKSCIFPYIINPVVLGQCFVEEEVVHYCVTNMPGAVGRTSTYALCNVTLPWTLRIASAGIEAAAAKSPAIAAAVNIHQGSVTNQAVAETFEMEYNARFGS